MNQSSARQTARFGSRLPHLPSPRTARLLERLPRKEELTRADERIVLRLVDAMIETRLRVAPGKAKRKAN